MRSDLAISERKTPLKILVVLTRFFSFSSALCWFRRIYIKLGVCKRDIRSA